MEVKNNSSQKRILNDLENEISSKKSKTVLINLDDLHSINLLNENVNQKTAFFCAKKSKDENDSEKAIIIIEKKNIDTSSNGIDKLFSDQTKLGLEMQNNEYTTYTATLPPEFCEAKATIIYPATKLHIKKYQKKSLEIVHETKEDYEKARLDSAFASKVLNLQWIYHILDGTKELDKVLYRNDDPVDGFVIVMDYKWHGKDINTLKCLGIPIRKDLNSIRDLRSEHISLLENMNEEALKVFQEKYGLKKNKIKSFFHYQPSFYHLHIHFANIEVDIGGMDVWRAHLFDDVIDNLKLCSDYYKNKTLTYMLGK